MFEWRDGETAHFSCNVIKVDWCWRRIIEDGNASVAAEINISAPGVVPTDIICIIGIDVVLHAGVAVGADVCTYIYTCGIV